MSLTERQREARRTRVGASEVAALVPEVGHPFTTPARIYARIVDGVEAETNEAMQDGQLAEAHVLAMARRKWRLRARACVHAYVHPTLPVTASPDALLLDGMGLVEVKTTSALWQSQPPTAVVYQVQCQLWLTHRSYAQVVVWNGRLRMYTVERDPDVITAIEDGVRVFRDRYLYPGIPPAPDVFSTAEWSMHKS